MPPGHFKLILVLLLMVGGATAGWVSGSITAADIDSASEIQRESAIVTAPPDAKTPLGSPGVVEPDDRLTPPMGGAGEYDYRLVQLIHRKVNVERRKHGIEPLSHDARLADIAAEHSHHMATADFISHTAPNGETLRDRYHDAGYSCQIPSDDGRKLAGGENIFWISIDRPPASIVGLAERIVTGWMDSPGHRRNLLNPNWRREGIGIYALLEDGDLEIYITQNFC